MKLLLTSNHLNLSADFHQIMDHFAGSLIPFSGGKLSMMLKEINED